MLIGYLSICLLVFIGLVHGDGWGQVASQSSASNSAPPREPLAGGINPVDLSDPETLKNMTRLATYGLQEINKQSNDLYRQTLIRVVKVDKQVVAGFLYNITFTTGQSSCRNTPENFEAAAETCPLSNDATATYRQCSVKILSQAWRHIRKVEGFSCAAADASVRTSS